MGRPLRILAAGYYGSGNAGDEIVLAGILASLEATSASTAWDLRALSASPVRTHQLHGVRSYARFSPVAVLSALMWCDCLILGGGSLIQDATSRRSASYYVWLMRAALSLRRKLFLWAQGFGPLRDASLRAKAGRAISRAAAVTLRDSKSLGELAALGVPEALLSLTADPAFSLQTSGQVSDTRDLFGVALREWPGIEAHERDVASACAAAATRSSLRLMFVPFQQPQDVVISDRASSVARVSTSDLNVPEGPAAMVELFDRMAMVCGMRLHSLILAARSHAPFLGIAYDPKVRRFCQAAGMPWLELDGLTEDNIFSSLSTLWDHRLQHKSALESFAHEQKRLSLETAQLFWSVMSG